MIAWLSCMYINICQLTETHTHTHTHTEREREREREREKELDIWWERGRRAEKLADRRGEMHFWCEQRGDCSVGFAVLLPLVHPRCDGNVLRLNKLHPKGDTNMCAIFYGNPFNGHLDILTQCHKGQTYMQTWKDKKLSKSAEKIFKVAQMSMLNSHFILQKMCQSNAITVGDTRVKRITKWHATKFNLKWPLHFAKKIYLSFMRTV